MVLPFLLLVLLTASDVAKEERMQRAENSLFGRSGDPKTVEQIRTLDVSRQWSLVREELNARTGSLTQRVTLARIGVLYPENIRRMEAAGFTVLEHGSATGDPIVVFNNLL